MAFRMMAYADNFEDVVLDRAFSGQDRGFYIDVGAYLPTDHSVTKHFYDKGWRGINIEPNPTPYAQLVADRTRDVNLNLGLSNVAGTLSVFESPEACWSADPRMLTGFFGGSAESIKERTIDVTTLRAICDQHVPPDTPIDFLKIDVEGHEKQVLEGADFARHRPRVLVIEAMGFEDWEPIMLNNGYRFTLFDGVNRFYVAEEQGDLAERIRVPANPTDAFSVDGYVRVINDLEQTVHNLRDELADYQRRYPPLGPTIMATAIKASALAARHPRLSRAVRRCLAWRRSPPA